MIVGVTCEGGDDESWFFSFVSTKLWRENAFFFFLEMNGGRENGTTTTQDPGPTLASSS